ncbi:MAG: ribosomal protein L13e [Candidatus Korarchaeota archaeon]|nr:ribosomal protein L13e [Candidatus Korarchaeota archaeon]
MRLLSPLVLTSTRKEKRKRVGRGFSIGELKEAGISLMEAKRKGIPIDQRRKTVHPWNVEALKKLVP